ncbi:unnamed protein product [Leptosia nina]|uniref:Lysozyme n=1 Tax=Leptosia nina TaxID=320188 RepID=A0AAV1IWP5_9NEOP
MKSVCLLFVVLVAAVEARQFSRCEIVKNLRHHGFPEQQMRDWVCLIEKESQNRNDAIGKLNADGSWDHGLFQINDRYWCSRGHAGKDCNVSCEALRSDNMGPAAKCAKKIFARHGFSAWTAWRAYCQGGLPNIGNC